MTISANPSQFEVWNGEAGHRWVARADQRDRVLAPVAEALLAVAAPTPGARVLDVGCGCGATSLMAATQVGETGAVSGIDLSGPMLELARRRATSAGAVNIRFMHGDAQTHVFEANSFDLIISRFGTMFFSGPVAAFINVRTALRPGGRLCLATWRPLAVNEWLTIPGAALLRHTDMPTTAANEPGMFAQSDPGIVTTTLSAAGFVDIALEATAVTFTLGQTVDEAVEYLADTGPGRALLETILEGPARNAALADMRDALVNRNDHSGVQLDGGIWLVTATRPEGTDRA